MRGKLIGLEGNRKGNGGRRDAFPSCGLRAARAKAQAELGNENLNAKIQSVAVSADIYAKIILAGKAGAAREPPLGQAAP